MFINALSFSDVASAGRAQLVIQSTLEILPRCIIIIIIMHVVRTIITKNTVTDVPHHNTNLRLINLEVR